MNEEKGQDGTQPQRDESQRTIFLKSKKMKIFMLLNLLAVVLYASSAVTNTLSKKLTFAYRVIMLKFVGLTVMGIACMLFEQRI